MKTNRLERVVRCVSWGLLLSCLAAGVACGSGEDVEAINASGPPEASICHGEPKSQPIFAPCCMTHGIDACGGGLFCAALDGRTQPTCYGERSRADLSTCTADLQCASGSCNTALGKCRSSPYQGCDRNIGCAPKPGGTVMNCYSKGNTCQSARDQGSYCDRTDECQTGLTCTYEGGNPNLKCLRL
jgi:hypothetical protein